MASPTGAECLQQARTIAQDIDDESANLGLTNARWLVILNECQREVWADLKRAQWVDDLVGTLTVTTAYRFPITVEGLAEVLRLEWSPTGAAGQKRGTEIKITSLDAVLAIGAGGVSAAAPTIAAVVPREGSDPDLGFELVTYPALTVTSKLFGAWIRKYPTDIANNSTQVDLQSDEADWFIRMAGVRGAGVLGHDPEFIIEAERPLPSQYQKFTRKQEKKIAPKDRAAAEVI